MPAAAIPLATSAIGGVFSAIGNKKPKTQTSTYNNKSSSSNTQKGVLDPEQNQVMQQIFQQLMSSLKLGPQVSQGDKNTANTRINNEFDSSASNMEANLAARGMGGGGTYGKELNKLSVAKSTAKQGAAATLQDQAMARFFQMLGIGQNFITPREFQTNSSGEQSGTSTGQQSGTPWQSSVGSGVSDLGSYLYLNKMMKGQPSGPNAGMANSALNGAYPCQIAMELWGADSWKVKVLRDWLMKQAEQSRSWRIGVTAYKAFGGAVASVLRVARFLRPMFERPFDAMLIRAMNA